MSHSVLVETARRFVEAFYDALARGARVGDAMLEASASSRTTPSAAASSAWASCGSKDWFVPVLFQEKDDPQLFRDYARAADAGGLEEPRSRPVSASCPQEPETGFIGRSRELLALERLLRH